MITISLIDILGRTISSVLTLYMMLILLRWTAPYLHVDLSYGWRRWAIRLTDPLLNAVRRILPPMGPMDFGPWAALFVLWLARSLAVGVLAHMAGAGPQP